MRASSQLVALVTPVRLQVVRLCGSQTARAQRRGDRSAHLTAGTAEEQVQDAVERRDEDDDDFRARFCRPRVWSASAKRLRQEIMSQIPKPIRSRATMPPATRTGAASSPITFGPP